jgi:hypothetical protein
MFDLLIGALLLCGFLLCARAIGRLSKPGGTDNDDSKKEGGS